MAKKSTTPQLIPLRVQIMTIERRILERQGNLMSRGRAIEQNIRQRLSSPVSLLLAVGVGFFAENLTRRKAQVKQSSLPNRRKFSSEQPGLLSRIIKAIAVTRAFLAALPPWLIAVPKFTRRQPNSDNSMPLAGAPSYGSPGYGNPGQASSNGAQNTVNSLDSSYSDTKY